MVPQSDTQHQNSTHDKYIHGERPNLTFSLHKKREFSRNRAKPRPDQRYCNKEINLNGNQGFDPRTALTCLAEGRGRSARRSATD